MSKNKSVFVTVLFAVMLAAIDACMLKLWPIGFGIITGTLAGLGYYKLACVFNKWLSHTDEEPLSLPEVRAQPVAVSRDEEINFTYDDIKADLEAGV